MPGDNPKPTELSVIIGKHHFLLESATSDSQRHEGLGGRMTMPQDHGMIFIVDEPQLCGVWMKGMHFALDIIWLDAEKTVIRIEPDVAPSTYPKIFSPEQPAKYVIELCAGQAGQVGLRVGQRLSL